ncbi:MAG: SCP2 sterol-binding domain-containing protein [Deltaproteobacteria bacterium]|nr:SCP2 sterol-binding domain-containing protein [Deltaproteobacteria bacterium]
MPIASAAEFFEQRLPKRLRDKPEVVAKIGASYKFVLQGDAGGTWVVDLTTPGGKITAGDGAGGCVITMAAVDFVDVINGVINAQMAFMTGKLKVAGDIGQALKLQHILG